MKNLSLLVTLALAGCAAQHTLLPPGSTSISSSQALSMEQISAFPKLKCDPNARFRSVVRARHIAITAFPKDTPAGAKATPEELRAAYAKLESAASDLNKGEPFETVWKRYSDPRASASGGDLGYFEKGTMIPEFEKVAFCLPIGEVSPIVRTVFGFHLIQVTHVRN